MKTSSRWKTFSIAALLIAATAVQAAAPWGSPLMQRGIAAITCGGPAQDNMGNPLPPATVFTFGVVDIRNPLPSDYGPCGTAAPLWNATMYHDPSWNVENIGSVFGITLDTPGNMYVAAHGLYGTYQPLHHRYGNLGGGATSLTAAGTVYRIDNVSGAATVFTVIPGQQTMVINPSFSSGPGLGNLAYDKTFNQFFVSSLEDGKIYRVSSAGAILNSFDPLTPDTGAVGLPPRSERVWAVEVLNGAVFYSIWNNGDASLPCVIRRVTLNGSGDFIPGSDVAVLTVPPQNYVQGGGTPVPDITFSLDGQTMIIGRRSMVTDTTAYNHTSATHEAKLISGVWTPVRTMNTGCNASEGEAYGGVAYGEEGGVQEAIIWATSADMAVNYGPHGMFGVRVPDFPTNGQAFNSYKAPYIPGFLNNSFDDRKGSGGDIEILRTTGCSELKVSDIHCPTTNGGLFTAVLDITNLGTSAVHYVWMTPCPTSGLPAGAVTGQPLPSGIIMLPTPLGTNASTSIPISLPGNVSGQTFCFRVTLLNKQGDECCTGKVCVDVPPCDCAEVLDRRVDCKVLADGSIQYIITLTIQNLTHLSANPFGFSYISLIPPTGFSPSFAIPTPNPIPPGGVGTVQLFYYGPPGQLCFNVGLHDDSLIECCSPEQICVDLPDCPPATGKPDTCALETKVPCCPPAPGVAMINYTICNNSTVPRTYSWTAAGFLAPGCTNLLTTASFSPSSGTLGPIPPGGCMTVPISIRCEGFKPGDCAGYRICSSYNAAVPPLCCEGIVYRPKQGEPVVKHPPGVDGSGVSIPPRGSTTVTLEVDNPTTTPMTVDLFLRDSSGVLSFSSDAASPRSVLYSTSVTISASNTATVTVQAHRIDGSGIGSPDFTSLEVWATRSGVPRIDEPDLIIPVRLLKGGAGGGLTVKNVRVEQTPTPQIIITVPTVAGRRYRIEQADEVTGAWAPATCTTPDTTIDGDGFMLGTGGDITCYVHCDMTISKMFFRAAEFP